MSTNPSVSRKSFNTRPKSLEPSTAPVTQQPRTSTSSQTAATTRSRSLTPTEHPGPRVSSSGSDSSGDNSDSEARDSATSGDARGSGAPSQNEFFEPLEPVQIPVLEAAGRKPFTPMTRAARSPVSDGPTSKDALAAFFDFSGQQMRLGPDSYPMLPSLERQFDKNIAAYVDACKREKIDPDAEALSDMRFALNDFTGRLRPQQRNPSISSESGEDAPQSDSGKASPSRRSTARQLNFDTPSQHKPARGAINDGVVTQGANVARLGGAFAGTEVEIAGLVEHAMARDPQQRAQSIRALLEQYGKATDPTRSRFHDAAFEAAREWAGELPPALAYLAAKAPLASAPDNRLLLGSLKDLLKGAVGDRNERDILGHRMLLDIELLAGTSEAFLPNLPVHRTVINRQPRSRVEADTAKEQAKSFLLSCKDVPAGTVKAALTFDQHHWMGAFVQRTGDAVQIYVFNQARLVSGKSEKIERDTLKTLSVAAAEAGLRFRTFALGLTEQEAGIQNGCGVIAYDLFKYVNARLAEAQNDGIPTPNVGELIKDYADPWKRGDQINLQSKERMETVVHAELLQAASTYVDEEMERSLGENQRDLVGKLKEQVKKMMAPGIGGRPLPERLARLRDAAGGFHNVMSAYNKPQGAPPLDEIRAEHRLLIEQFSELCGSLREIEDLEPFIAAAWYLDLPLDEITAESARRVQAFVRPAQIAPQGANSVPPAAAVPIDAPGAVPVALELTREAVRARAAAPVSAWVDAALKPTSPQQLVELRDTARNAAVGALPNAVARELFDDAFSFHAQRHLAGMPDLAENRRKLAAKLRDPTFDPVQMHLVTVDQTLAESMHSVEFAQWRAETASQANRVLDILMQLHRPQGALPAEVREVIDHLNVKPLIGRLTAAPDERLDDNLENSRDVALDQAYRREMVAHYTPLLQAAQSRRPDDVMRLRNNIENVLRKPRTGNGAFQPAVLAHLQMIHDLLPAAGAQFGPALTAPVDPVTPKLVAAQKKAQGAVGSLVLELAKEPGSRKATRQQARFQAAINRLVKTAGAPDAQRRQLEYFVNHNATPRELFTLHIHLYEQISEMPAGQSRENAAQLLGAIDKRVFAWSRQPKGAEIIRDGLQDVPESIMQNIEVVDYLVAKITAPVARALTDTANVDKRPTYAADKLDQKAAALAKVYGDAVEAFTARSLPAAQDSPGPSHNGFIDALAVAHRALSEFKDEGFDPEAQKEITNANAAVEIVLGAMPNAWWKTMTDAQLQRAQAEIAGLGIVLPLSIAVSVNARQALAGVEAADQTVTNVDARGRPLSAAALASGAAVRPALELLEALRNSPNAGLPELLPTLDALHGAMRPLRDSAMQIGGQKERDQFVLSHVQIINEAIADYVRSLPKAERVALQQALRDKLESPAFDANRSDLHLAHIAVNEVVHAQELKESSIAAQAAAQHVFRALTADRSTPDDVSHVFGMLDSAIRPYYMIHGAGPTAKLVNDHRELVYRQEVGALLGQLLQEHEKVSPKGLHDVRKQLDAKLGSSRFESVRKELEFVRSLLPAPSLKDVVAGTDKKAVAHQALFGKVRDLMLAVADPGRVQPGRRMNQIIAEVQTASKGLLKVDRTLTFDAAFTAHVDHHLASFADTAAGIEQLRNLHLRLAMVNGEGRRGLTHEENLIQQALTRMLDNAPVDLVRQVFGLGFVQSVEFLAEGFEASVEGSATASLQSELVTRLVFASSQLGEFTKVARTGRMVNIDQQVSKATEALSESLARPEPAYWQSMTTAQLTRVHAVLTSFAMLDAEDVLGVISDILAERATEGAGTGETAPVLVRGLLDSLIDAPFIAGDALGKITSKFRNTLGSTTENSHAALSLHMTEYVDAMREPQRTALLKTVRAKLSSTEFALSHGYLALAHRALTEEMHGETFEAARKETAKAAKELLDTLAQGIGPARAGDPDMFAVRLANKLQVAREAAFPIASRLATTDHDRSAMVQRELESALHQLLSEREDLALLRRHLETAIDSLASAPVRHHLLFIRDQFRPVRVSGPLHEQLSDRGDPLRMKAQQRMHREVGKLMVWLTSGDKTDVAMPAKLRKDLVAAGALAAMPGLNLDELIGLHVEQHLAEIEQPDEFFDLVIRLSDMKGDPEYDMILQAVKRAMPPWLSMPAPVLLSAISEAREFQKAMMWMPFDPKETESALLVAGPEIRDAYDGARQFLLEVLPVSALSALKALASRRSTVASETLLIQGAEWALADRASLAPPHFIERAEAFTGAYTRGTPLGSLVPQLSAAAEALAEQRALRAGQPPVAKRFDPAQKAFLAVLETLGQFSGAKQWQTLSDWQLRRAEAALTQLQDGGGGAAALAAVRAHIEARRQAELSGVTPIARSTQHLLDRDVLGSQQLLQQAYLEFRGNEKSLLHNLSHGLLHSGYDMEDVSDLMLHLPLQDLRAIASTDTEIEGEEEVRRVASMALHARVARDDVNQLSTVGQSVTMTTRELLKIALEYRAFLDELSGKPLPRVIWNVARDAEAKLRQKVSATLPSLDSPEGAAQAINILAPAVLQKAGITAARAEIDSLTAARNQHYAGTPVTRDEVQGAMRAIHLFQASREMERMVAGGSAGLEDVTATFNDHLSSLATDVTGDQRKEISEALRDSGLDLHWSAAASTHA